MSHQKTLGDFGEAVASDYLLERGYTKLAGNLRCKYGEIDLVMQKENRLYFVEIKTRTHKGLGSLLEAVTLTKQKRIRQTAAIFLAKNAAWRRLIPFFSVLTLNLEPDGHFHIEFLPDAFY